MMNRRRFLTISAAIAGTGAIAGAVAGTLFHGGNNHAIEWSGLALGAQASIRLEIGQTGKKSGSDGEHVSRAENALVAALDTIRRMESLFSIYDPASQVSCLNRKGEILASPEFLQLLERVDEVHAMSDGLFDPGIQPLFAAMMAGKSRKELHAAGVAAAGWKNVERIGSHVRFLRPHMALTFNGIAQGYATDRVTQTLKAHGFDQVVVNLGEYRVGKNAARIAIADTADKVLKQVTLAECAIATTSPFAMILPGNQSHLIRPDGQPFAPHWDTVSVVAETAAMADGFSTAIGLCGDDHLARRLLAENKLQSVFLKAMDGSEITL